MTRFGTLVTSTVVAALMSVVPDASGQARGVLARGDATLRPIATSMQGSVDGVVLDDAGLPVAGATVSALGATSALAISDRGGRFSLANLSPGPYLLRAHTNGYIPSRRQFVEVRAAATTTVAVSMRRTDRTRVMAAGVAGADTGEDNQPIDDHSEVAWRLRHIPRSVLKDVDTAEGVVGGTDTSGDKNGFARAMGSPAHLASALFDDLPFTGQVNLLTGGSFDSVQGLFSSDVLSRSMAALSLRGPAGAWGDWSIQGITSQGDLGSWFVSGALKSHVPASHVYDVNVSYSAKRANAAPLVVTSLPTPADDNRAVGTLYAVDRWRVNPQVTLTYAARYSRYDYLGGAGFISPAASLAIKPADGFEVRTSVSRHVLVPGAEEFLPPLAAGLWVPTERTFNWLSPTSLRAERTNNYEFAIDHDLGGGYTVTARAFYQEVQNQLVAIFGLNTDSAVSASYHAGTIGSLDAHGWSVAISNFRSKHVRGSVAYETTTAQWRDLAQSGVLAVVAPSLIRTSERLHDVVATVDTQVPVTATHVFVLYRIDTAFARRPGAGSTPGFDARFDFQLSQPLPVLDFTSAQWQVVFAVRNLFRESSADGSVYDELLVVRPPKRLVGGLVVRF